MKAALAIASILTCFAILLHAETPAELIQHNTGYAKALENVSAPVRATYVAELGKLQDKSTKAGNLDAASQVRKMLEQMTGSPSTAAPTATITAPSVAAKSTASASPAPAPSFDGALAGYVHEGKNLVMLDMSGKSLEQVRAFAKRHKLGLYGFDGHDSSPQAIKDAVAALLGAKISLGRTHHNSWIRIPGITLKQDGTLLREPEMGGKSQPIETSVNLLSQFLRGEDDFTKREDERAVAYNTHSAGNGLIRIPEANIQGGRIILAVFTTAPTASPR